MLSAGTKLGGRWTVGKHLGTGACAEVYAVQERDPETNAALVVKCIPLAPSKGKKAAQKEQQRIADTLYYEYTLYTNGLLFGFGAAPKVPRGAYGQDAGHRYMVMEALDHDLRVFAADRPSFAAISEVGLQILAGLQFIHGKGYVFVDIKPDNFMMKAVNGKDKLFFIDFGLMEKITGYMSGGAQREEAHRAVVAGTAAFVSLHVHRGGTPSKRDDLEAMAYVLLALTSADCSLPWVGAHVRSDADCLSIKEEADIADLCRAQGCPQLAEIISICRTTDYSADPDYNRIKALLSKMRDLKGAPSKAGRRRSSAAEARHAEPPAPASAAKNKRSSRGKDPEEVVDLVGSDDEEVARPSKVAKKAKTTSARGKAVAVEQPDPTQTPLLFDDPPAPRGRKTTAKKVIDSPARDSLGPVDLVVCVLSGPHEGETRSLPRSNLAEKRGGRKKKASDNEAEEASCVCIGRMCEGSAATSALLLPDDEYVSDRHALIQSHIDSTGVIGFRIKDLGSTNGIKMNKQKLSAGEWTEGRIGDTFRVGATTLHVVLLAPTPVKASRRK